MVVAVQMAVLQVANPAKGTAAEMVKQSRRVRQSGSTRATSSMVGLSSRSACMALAVEMPQDLSGR
jgi:hypothetical protein